MCSTSTEWVVLRKGRARVGVSIHMIDSTPHAGQLAMGGYGTYRLSSVRVYGEYCAAKSQVMMRSAFTCCALCAVGLNQPNESGIDLLWLRAWTQQATFVVAG